MGALGIKSYYEESQYNIVKLSLSDSSQFGVQDSEIVACQES